MSLTEQEVLIANGYLLVRGDSAPSDLQDLAKNPEVVTLVNNFNYYGFMPSVDILKKLLSLSLKELVNFWNSAENALKNLTADNRQMDDFVVYQNFPKEVLEKSKAEYWTSQILMYFGFDKGFFVEDKVERAPLTEKRNFKVLHLADTETTSKVFNSLLQNKARWSALQLDHAKFLIKHLHFQDFGMDQISFRENGIQLINYLLDNNSKARLRVEDATDVLRLAALRSEADVSLRENIKFKSFSRAERRFFCQLLEGSKHLEADVAEREALWKLLFRRLHPGDFTSPKVQQVYDKLYKGELKSFASQVEAFLASKNSEVLTLLQKRPGDFTRRFHKLYSVFGEEAVKAFVPLMKHLTNHQLVKLVKYVETINYRKFLTYPPKGNWTRLQIKENTKTALDDKAVKALRHQAANLIKERLQKLVPDGFDLGPQIDHVKLQTNDQELASYGRGTIFEIPQNMTFLRTASYWENKGYGVSWFDNGWNFFDTNWNYLGAVCWNHASFDGSYQRYSNRSQQNAAAIFSGDPINKKDLKGRAAQMIDLYLDRLSQLGVRYAVWNILSYNRIPFDKVTGEVVATLQWGEEAQSGKLYEPSRAQLIFPLKGNNLTKYIAYLDVEKRQLIYLDANLRGKVSSAGDNGTQLSERMPAFLEYLESLPSLADLLSHAEKGKVPVVYSDKDRDLKDQQLAYVFKSENDKNQFKALDLDRLLS